MVVIGARRAAWGFHLEGVDDAQRVLTEADPAWPTLRVQATQTDESGPDQVAWSDQRVLIPLLGGGWVVVEREPLSAALSLPRRPADECVVQPHLASAIATASLWAGRQAFHGGCFVLDGGAWMVLGEKEDGKSTTMAWLHLLGLSVMADDLTSWSEGQVFAGPRCVDLRPEPARVLGAGRDLGIIGTRPRLRVDLPPCPPRVPLRGFVRLAWGPVCSVDDLSLGERLHELEAHRALRLPWLAGDALLELASLPAVRWSRPRSWEQLGPAVQRLVDGLADRDRGPSTVA